jgi:hypothetical protein
VKTFNKKYEANLLCIWVLIWYGAHGCVTCLSIRYHPFVFKTWFLTSQDLPLFIFNQENINKRHQNKNFPLNFIVVALGLGRAGTDYFMNNKQD